MTQQIQIGEYSIDVERKRIKHLHLAVYMQTGRIRVSVPLHLDDLQIRRFLESRLNWIAQKHQAVSQKELSPLREYKNGETHYLEGKAYLLNVISGSGMNMLKLREDSIDLYLQTDSPLAFKAAMFKSWHKARLKVRCESLIQKWQPIMGVQIKYLGIRQMKTRWGTCNPTAKRIWINLELARLADDSLEFIVVHELAHLLERGHNAAFRACMDRFLPDWRQREQSLKSRSGMTDDIDIRTQNTH